MKKVIVIVICVCTLLTSCVLFTLSGCKEEKKEVSDYQFMYDGIVRKSNKLKTKEGKQENLFGYGEYLYNSYLLLFPRETPSTLTEYYFSWSAGVDVDFFAIYFTCKLEEENFNGFCLGLESFEIKGEETRKPLYDTTHFSLPTYILQWAEVGDKWEVLEYIMLDKQSNTVVFVYTMSELARIEENSKYTVAPTDRYFLEKNFSIYVNYIGFQTDSSNFYEENTFDISFLEYLS